MAMTSISTNEPSTAQFPLSISTRAGVWVVHDELIEDHIEDHEHLAEVRDNSNVYLCIAISRTRKGSEWRSITYMARSAEVEG